MTGQGHEDWLAQVDFHPRWVLSSAWLVMFCMLRPLGLNFNASVSQIKCVLSSHSTTFQSGSQLATASGDGTVKVWDFARGKCVLTFSDHQQPGMWNMLECRAGRAVSWWPPLQSGAAAGIGVGTLWCLEAWTTAARSGTHTGKPSMPATIAMYYAIPPPRRGRCLVSLRGHADSVNAVSFLPFSNTICSCSADKTLSLWDARTVRTDCLTSPSHGLMVHASLPGSVCADLLWPSALLQ